MSLSRKERGFPQKLCWLPISLWKLHKDDWPVLSSGDVLSNLIKESQELCHSNWESPEKSHAKKLCWKLATDKSNQSCNLSAMLRAGRHTPERTRGSSEPAAHDMFVQTAVYQDRHVLKTVTLKTPSHNVDHRDVIQWLGNWWLFQGSKRRFVKQIPQKFQMLTRNNSGQKGSPGISCQSNYNSRHFLKHHKHRNQWSKLISLLLWRPATAPPTLHININRNRKLYREPTIPDREQQQQQPKQNLNNFSNNNNKNQYNQCSRTQMFQAARGSSSYNQLLLWVFNDGNHQLFHCPTLKRKTADEDFKRFIS